MKIEEIEALARQDADEVIDLADTLAREFGGELILVKECQMMAPSMRALPHGDLAWNEPDVDVSHHDATVRFTTTAFEVYVETFDEIIDTHNTSRQDGRILLWADGDLWLTTPEEG